jgi:hypothetical protein
MQGESFFYNPVTQQQIAYPYVFANDAIRQEILAKPIITGFSPRQLRAGTKDTLTITGTNFGTTKGKIWFPNADTGYISYVSVVDSAIGDIVSWTNTTIKTLVPSESLFGNQPAGSGRFIVQSASSPLDTTKSLDSLEIIYALQNYRATGVGATYNSFRINLVDTNQQGGITFRYHPNFSSKPKAALCFEEALKKWRCTTGVNFIVGRDTNLATTGVDGVSQVKFASSRDFAALGLSPNTLAITYTSGGRFYTCGNRLTDIGSGHTHEIDLLFKDSIGLWYIDTVSTTTIPSGYVDFYTVCLHEQGHGHRLNHAIGNQKVMFWAIQPSVRRRNLNSADIQGGFNIVDSSIVFRPSYNPRNCQPTPMKRVASTNCNMLTSVYTLEKRNQSVLKSYPNPSTSYHNIDIELKDYQVVGIRVYDLLGKAILESNLEKYDSGSHTLMINTVDLLSGMYLLEVMIGSEKYVTKFIKN